ncbi:Nuclear envelope pore membrane protein POM 121 [Lemmus lemmus]
MLGFALPSTHGGRTGLAGRGGQRGLVGPESRAPRPTGPVVVRARLAPRPVLTASLPPTKSAVNGSLCEPRSPLGGPDPAELLLMGSYLGKPGPPQPAVAQDPRDRPGRLRRRRRPSESTMSIPRSPPRFYDPPGGYPTESVGLYPVASL